MPVSRRERTYKEMAEEAQELRIKIAGFID
jgi:hypothetical protein